MFCPKCGAQSEQGRFCRSCGTNLAVVSEVIGEKSDQAARREKSGGPLSAATEGGGMTLGLFSPAAIANDVRNLAGHKAAALFGNVTVDLTAAALPEGETHIGAYTLFGSIDILVPDDVGVRVTGITAFSGVSLSGEPIVNGWFHTDEYVSPDYQAAARRLHIEVATLFSGLQIKQR